MKTRLSEDGTKLVATYELHPFDFDRSGSVQAWTFLRMLEHARRAAIPRNDANMFHHDNATAFVRYQEVEVAQNFYSFVKPNTSLVMSTGVSYVGRSSLFYSYDILSSQSRKVLGHSQCQMVRVNAATRRAIAWPDVIIDKYGKKGQDRPVIPGPFKERPEPVVVYDVTVTNSDMDENHHANQSVYLRYCLDAAATAARKNVFRVIKDTAFCPIKKVGMLYQKEALLGDKLTVELWEDEGCAETLCFQIKRGEEEITQISVQFFILDRARL